MRIGWDIDTVKNKFGINQFCAYYNRLVELDMTDRILTGEVTRMAVNASNNEWGSFKHHAITGESQVMPNPIFALGRDPIDRKEDVHAWESLEDGDSG